MSVTYRYPTSILWSHPDGYRYRDAASIDDIAQKLPCGITLANVQVKVGDDWCFASETPPHFGGYDRRSTRRLP